MPSKAYAGGEGIHTGGGNPRWRRDQQAASHEAATQVALVKSGQATRRLHVAGGYSTRVGVQGSSPGRADSQCHLGCECVGDTIKCKVFNLGQQVTRVDAYNSALASEADIRKRKSGIPDKENHAGFASGHNHQPPPVT